MKRAVLSSIVVLIILAIAAWASSAVSAQSGDGCPDGANCISADNFDSGTDGWIADHATIEWLANQNLGILGSTARGVLHVFGISPDPNRSGLETAGVYKTFYLQPGVYHILFRAGQAIDLLSNGFYLHVSSNGTDAYLFSSQLPYLYYGAFETGTFEVTSPESVKIYFAPDANAYIDYLWLERMPDTYPTPTPFGLTSTPGGPSPTPRPTSIPVDQQATSVPTGSPVCNASTPTPTGIPAFATATTPTATPPNVLSRLESFDQSVAIDVSGPWSRLGLVRMDLAADHTGNGGMSALVPYDPHGAITTTSSFESALILSDSFGYGVWINVWAKADLVPIGETAYFEIWEQLGGTWQLQSASVISPRWWYPAHAAIDSGAAAIAFVARRTDLPSAGAVDVDDIYVYAPETHVPSCSGVYPADVTNISGDSLGGGSYSTVLSWPADRPCPHPAPIPNNFWGPLLNGVALFVDQYFAWMPLHQPGWLTITAQNTLLSPVGVLFTFCAILLDWTIPITVLKIWLGLQGIYFVIMAWRLVRYSTVQ